MRSLFSIASIALAAAGISDVSAETLRVPQDFSLVQRAISAAAPGDTVLIAAGTYEGNFSVLKPLTIQGAGLGKTVLLGRNREFNVLDYDAKGKFVLRGLTLKHGPKADDPDATEGMGLRLSHGEVVVSDISVEESVGTSIFLYSTRATLENISIVGTNGTYAMQANELLPGSTIKKVRFSVGETVLALAMENGACTFTDLAFNEPKPRSILITGENAAAKFENLKNAPEDFVLYEDGAKPEGPAKLVTPSDANTEDGEPPDPKIAEHTAAVAAQRRALVRELEKSMRGAKTSDEVAKVLLDYFTKMRGTLLEDESNDEVSSMENCEMEEFGRRFSARELDNLTPQFAVAFKQDVQTVNGRIGAYLFRPIEREKKVQAEEKVTEGLPALLAGWKKEKGTDPKVAAASFIEVIKAVSAKAENADSDLTEKIRNQLLGQISLFVDAHGPKGFNQLVRQMAAVTNTMVASENLHYSLSDQQRLSYVKWLIAGR